MHCITETGIAMLLMSHTLTQPYHSYLYYCRFALKFLPMVDKQTVICILSLFNIYACSIHPKEHTLMSLSVFLPDKTIVHSPALYGVIRYSAVTLLPQYFYTILTLYI